MLSTAVAAGVVLLGTVAVGILVHEYLHVLVLRASGVQCAVVFRPGRSRGSGFQGMVSGPLASVEMEAIPAACSHWRLRVAALAPLAMLLPVGVYAWAVSLGGVTDSTLASMVVIGWMACALPSPADFAIVWHPREAREKLSGARDASSN